LASGVEAEGAAGGAGVAAGAGASQAPLAHAVPQLLQPRLRRPANDSFSQANQAAAANATTNSPNLPLITKSS
jgi:hypothetical protein